MKYLKIAIIGFVIILSTIVIYSAYSIGWAGIFILPIIIITAYIAYYLHAQFERENQESLEKEVKLAEEDLEGEQWIKNSLVPKTITYSKRKRWTIIIYTFLFIAGLFFVWQYISRGLETAIRDVIVLCIVFWLFVYYVIKIPDISKWFTNIMPDTLKKVAAANQHNVGNWGRAYIFLFPVALIFYILYPPEQLVNNLITKLSSLPVFFLGYTFSFLSLYSIIYISGEMEKDNKNKLEKEMKEIL